MINDTAVHGSYSNSAARGRQATTTEKCDGDTDGGFTPTPYFLLSRGLESLIVTGARFRVYRSDSLPVFFLLN